MRYAETKDLSPLEKQALNMWEHCVTTLADDPFKLDRECDWVIKHNLIEAYRAKHDLPLASPLSVQPGTYWIGFITGPMSEGMGYAYDSVQNSRAYNTNAYSSGPSDPFGAASLDSEQASIYATYVPGA